MEVVAEVTYLVHMESFHIASLESESRDGPAVASVMSSDGEGVGDKELGLAVEVRFGDLFDLVGAESLLDLQPIIGCNVLLCCLEFSKES